MKHNAMKEQISAIVRDQLSREQIDELMGFVSQAMHHGLDMEDEVFFCEIAHEMTDGIKELALMIVEFRKDIKSKISPDITEMATTHLPKATDQLEGIIETTEKTANKVMDNLEQMQTQMEQMETLFSAFKKGEIKQNGDEPKSLDAEALSLLMPVIKQVEDGLGSHNALISDIFTQMSFQDLTGQRIKQIMNLVGQMEQKLTKMIISFGIQMQEKENNPGISKAEIESKVDEKVCQLAGPQREGQGLAQNDIDDLLGNL